tara:strand:+ start:68 stop:1348 length:1281 start_codon:yes stop_codon:yes gene_type:complete
MHAGLESRLIIHNILKMIKIKSISFDEAFYFHTKKILNVKDKKFIHNTTLTAIRNYLIIEKIIDGLVKSINKESDTFFLLLSAICQINFLNVKEYAVVSSSVELSKNTKIKTHTKLINGCLRNFLRKKNHFNEIKINFNDMPKWFIKETKKLSDNQKKLFLESIFQQPTLHLVFKENINISEYLKFGIQTSDKSLAINKNYSFSDIPNFIKGEWWVQDFSTMLPLSLVELKKFKSIADVCSAPGGKLFQILNQNKNVIGFEKNKKRIKVLNQNLERLRFSSEIKVMDFLNFNEENKFDLIVIDAPCSSIGTIRRNPELFFKKENPNFNFLTNIQAKLLEKSKIILKNKGILIYMVCSFLEKETIQQINNFLKRNKNFKISSFDLNRNILSRKIIKNEKYFHTMPTKIMTNVKIDGYFAVKLIKEND